MRVKWIKVVNTVEYISNGVKFKKLTIETSVNKNFSVKFQASVLFVF